MSGKGKKSITPRKARYRHVLDLYDIRDIAPFLSQPKIGMQKLLRRRKARSQQ